MGQYIARYAWGEGDLWGLVDVDQVYPLHTDFFSLKELLVAGRGEIQNMATNRPDSSMPAADVEFLSPLTNPCRMICVGPNFLELDPESGEKVNHTDDFHFYRKDESSLTGANSPIIRPEGSRMLDYGVELGLIIGRSVREATEITEENVENYVAGLVMVNDILARDHILQAPARQAYQGTSYRSLSPVGPYFYLLDKGELNDILPKLELKLWVNEEIRQSAQTQDWVISPATMLTEIAKVVDLEVGDVVLTGRPGGYAFKPASKSTKRIAGLFLSEDTQVKMFIDKEASNPLYLKDGDAVKATISSTDGRVDLGTIENKVG